MSKVYLEAAKIIHTSGGKYVGCCNAIVKAPSYNEFQYEIGRFSTLFTPDFPTGTAFWGNAWSANLKKRKACREFALLLMHAIDNYREEE